MQTFRIKMYQTAILKLIHYFHDQVRTLLKSFLQSSDEFVSAYLLFLY
jgi:hypothetical protein